MRQDTKQSLLRLDTVKQRTGLSRSTIYAYMSDNRFPKAINVSERCVAWIESEIDDWIDTRINKRKA
jgi:prophage regulatory protein